MTIDLHAAVRAQADALIATRRDFHRHPEMGFEEVRTAGIVAKHLNGLGLEVQTGIAKTGIIVLLVGDKPGPTVQMRFDMDALPIQEANTTDYISTNPGVMHACGHDGHTAIGMTVASVLNAHRSEIAGTLKFVFQPAEEGQGGARSMVAEGALEMPRHDVSLGLHLWNDKPVGWLAATHGPAMAASEVFEVQLTGKGGHGASPYQTLDPVVAAAQIITAIQSIPARNVDARESAVISVTTVHAGDAFNVIPQTATLGGTIRTFQPAIRELTLRRFREVVEGVAQAMGCQADITLRSITRAVINTPEVADTVLATARTLPELFTNFSTSERTMGSEDYGELAGDAPSCFFFVGSADPARGLDYPHHHPRFDFDEQALVNGATLMAMSAAKYVLPENG